MTTYRYPEGIDESTKEYLLRHNKWLNGQERIESNKAYKLVKDVDNSWSCNNKTHLSKKEIMELIKMDGICKGCRFVNINTNELFEIKFIHKGRLNGLQLVRIEN